MKQMTAAEILSMSVLHPRFVREERDIKIKEMRKSGSTLQQIADKFAITRQRVSQISGERSERV